VAILLEARLLVLLTNTDGLYTADPALDREAKRIETVSDFAELSGLDIGDRTSAFGSGGMRSKVAAAEMASEAGIPATICDGTSTGTLTAAAVSRLRAPRRRASSSGSSMPSRFTVASMSTPVPPGSCATAVPACCRWA
jgi:glutamate 5-kinase